MRKETEELKMITVPKIAKSLSVCKNTISRKLKELGYKKAKPLERPALASQAIRKCIAYFLVHMHDRIFFFSDEAIIRLQENRHLMWYSESRG